MQNYKHWGFSFADDATDLTGCFETKCQEIYLHEQLCLSFAFSTYIYLFWRVVIWNIDVFSKGKKKTYVKLETILFLSLSIWFYLKKMMGGVLYKKTVNTLVVSFYEHYELWRIGWLQLGKFLDNVEYFIYTCMCTSIPSI